MSDVAVAVAVEVLMRVVPLNTRTVWLVIGDPPFAGMLQVARRVLLLAVATGANGVAGTELTTGIVVVVVAAGIVVVAEGIVVVVVGVLLSMKTSRLGEFVPAEVMIPVVALVAIAEANCAGVNAPFNCRVSAANPATCGLAIDVPEMVLVAVVDPIHEEVIDTPGANTSMHDP